MWHFIDFPDAGADVRCRRPPHMRTTGNAGFAGREAFVRAMSRTVSGVNVVTTDGPAGRFGVTVSAFSPVSADPPMVLVCINRRSPVASALRCNGEFCVNVLAAPHERIADTFAGRPREGAPYEFAGAAWTVDAGRAPRLVDACATLDCVLQDARELGSHTVFTGRVTAAAAGSRAPLLYCDRTYGLPATMSC